MYTFAPLMKDDYPDLGVGGDPYYLGNDQDLVLDIFI